MTDDDGDARVDALEEPTAAAVASEDEPPTVTVGSDGFRPDQADEPGPGVDLESCDPDASDGVDWRGWLLVAVIVVSFVVVPGIVLLRPLRVVGFRTTYLLLPLLPAVVLGATAVWVAVRSRQEGR